MASHRTLDRCMFATATTGTTDFAVGAAITGFQTPAAAGATNGDTFFYVAESADLSQWEFGLGTYSTTGPTLARPTVVLANSSGGTSKINFTNAPRVYAVMPAEIGDIVENTVLVGAAVSATTGTNLDICFIDLPAGSWDVWANMCTDVGGSTVTAVVVGWIHTVSVTEPTKPNGGAHLRQIATLATGDSIAYPIGMKTYNVVTTTRVYLSARFGFSGGTLSAYGYIGARRRK